MGAVIGAPSGKRPTIEALALPSLHDGERLILGSSKSQYSVSVDGREQGPGRAIIASRLSLGQHVVEVVGRERKQRPLRIQIPLNVLSPIEVRVPPITQFEVSKKKNGGVIDVELHNHSRGEHLVRIEAEATPPGWTAIRLGRPTYVIKPRKSRRVRLQVERMIQRPDAGLLMFGLRVSFPSGAARDIAASFQVSVAEDTGG